MKTILLWLAGGFGGFCLLALLLSIGHGRYVRHTDRVYHEELSKTLRLGSEAFEDHGLIPPEFSCEQAGDGRDVSPPLAWSGAPEGAKSFVLIAIDPDIPSSAIQFAEFTHWALYNIPADVMELPARISHADLNELGIRIGRNGAGQKQFYPPCPLSGTHDYLFRLYALGIDGIQPKKENKRSLLAAMEGYVLAYGELTGRYQCQKFDMKTALRWNMTRMAQN